MQERETNYTRNLLRRAQSWGNRRRVREGLPPLEPNQKYTDGRIANPRQQRERLGLHGHRSGKVRNPAAQ